jgi:hypothetical protein
VTLYAARLALVLLLVGSAGCGGDRITPTQQQPPSTVEEPPVGFLPFSAISASGRTACGVPSDGGTYCWGAAVASSRPVRLHTAPPFVEIDVQDFWERRGAGAPRVGLHAWGELGVGQQGGELGAGLDPGAVRPLPQPLALP